MDTFDIYSDISVRCGGDIYVGVVGPVRSGKSTFITKFLNELVLPNMTDPHKKERTTDEMPQSAGGKTIMTTQPKFVPNEAVKIKFGDSVEANIRLIDCVGYLIDGAMGHMEGDKPRLVKTPWSENDMPFEKAAEFGTQKVITEHSTIGILVTSDGSITDIARSSYVSAEERVVSELKELGKPFVVLLNSKNPEDSGTQKMRVSLQEKYGVPVMAVNVAQMQMKDINALLEKLLMEFPLKTVDIELPKWMQALAFDSEIIAKVADSARMVCGGVSKMKDYEKVGEICRDFPEMKAPSVSSVKLGEGRVTVTLDATSELYYKVLSNECGCEISDDYHLISYIKQLTYAKTKFDKLKNALDEVAEKGYGVVIPTMDEMILEQPEVVKQGGKFGVRLKASAPSLHIMKVDINTEISPIVGTEQQSEELLNYLLKEFENNPEGIWETNMFGKSLHMLVKEGLTNKLLAMPEEAQKKMRRTLSRIINEGKGGVICILL